MKVIVPPLEDRFNGADDPFEHDLFARRDFIDNLTTLFRSCDDGLVITIDSAWGGGKTSLVKLWEHLLDQDQQFIPIYYDAFKNDFTGDAFLSIAVLIHEAFKERLNASAANRYGNKAQLKNLKSKSIEVTKNLARMGVGVAVSSLTGGLVDSKKLVDAVGKGVADIAFDTLELNTDAKFEAHSKSMKLVEEFQSALKDLVQMEATQERPNKVVFFIDELDRCRPDFAVQVIEKVKHLFNVDHVHFVLAVNRSQLLATISSAYGVDKEDATTYLQKFVHIETRLPGIKQQGIDINGRYLFKVWGLLGLNQYFVLDRECTVAMAKYFENLQPLVTPRAIERAFSYIAIALTVTPDMRNRAAVLTVYWAAMTKVLDPWLYRNMSKGDTRNILNDRSPDAHRLKLGHMQTWLGEVLGNRYLQKQEGHRTYQEIEGLAGICRIIDSYHFPEEP